MDGDGRWKEKIVIFKKGTCSGWIIEGLAPTALSSTTPGVSPLVRVYLSHFQYPGAHSVLGFGYRRAEKREDLLRDWR